MSLEIVIFRQHLCTNKLLAQNLHKVKQVLWILIADVVNCIRRNRKTIFTILLVWCFLHHTNNALNDVIHISKITLAVAIVEDFDGFALHQLVGESEVSHVRTTCRAIHRKESQASGRNVVELGVCVCHQLIRFLGCCIKGYRVINLVVGAVRNLLVGTVDRRRRSIHQMIQTLATTAGFKDIKEADQVRFHICIRIGDGVAHTSLCCKVNDHRRLVLLEQLGDQCLISDVAFYKSECGILGQLVQAELFQRHIIVSIHVIDADNRRRRSLLINSLHKVGTYKAGRTCD